MAGNPVSPPSSATAQAAACAVRPAPPPDVVLSGRGSRSSCTIGDGALKEIQERALKLMHSAGDKAFGRFPIDRNHLAASTVSKMFTRDNICRVLTAPSGATAENHNRLRKGYRGRSTKPEEALKRGVVAARIPLEAQCPEAFDWAHAPEFSDVDECSDVTDEFDVKGVGTAMYAVRIPADDAKGSLSLQSSPYYTRYTAGPVACSENGGQSDSFHRIFACSICSDLEFVMRSFSGMGWAAWTLSDSCTTPDGETHSPADLLFNNGVRIFLPLEVDAGGTREERSIVMSQVAAVTTSAWAFLIPADLPFHRFTGSEVAKRLFLEARQHGWPIK